MIAQLLRVAIVSTVLMWLRPQWKWLAACAAVILAAIYLHAEFLGYVAALPAGSHRATTASRYIPLAFVLKNVVILGALLAYFLFEMRRRKTIRRGPAEVSSSRAAMQSMPGGAPASETDETGDGFDFLRHGGSWKAGPRRSSSASRRDEHASAADRGCLMAGGHEVGVAPMEAYTSLDQDLSRISPGTAVLRAACRWARSRAAASTKGSCRSARSDRRAPPLSPVPGEPIARVPE